MDRSGHLPRTATLINSSTTKKHNHVRFHRKPDVHDFVKVSRDDWPMLWYNRDELHHQLDQDTRRAHHSTAAANYDNDLDFTDRGLEDERGLAHVLLLEDEQRHKDAPIQAYLRNVLGVYQYGQAEYGAEADPDRLRSFAVSRSRQDRERAERLAQQDAREVRHSYI